jgi:hypothetical protein
MAAASPFILPYQAVITLTDIAGARGETIVRSG